MKKIIRLVLAAIAFTVVGIVPAASAQASCSIGTTGPSSVNTCTFTNSNLVTVTCINGVQVTNTNIQNSTTGTANVSGNTISGTATSGDATNVNALATELALNCAGAPAVAANPTPAPTPAPSTPAGGAGGVVGGVSTTAQASGVAALPETGSETILAPVAIGAVVLGGLSVLAQLGVSGYRRLTLR